MLAGTAEPPTAEMRLSIPQSLAEVDNGKIMGFAADLAEDHPVSVLSWEMLQCLGAYWICPVACVVGPVPTVCAATGGAAADVSLLAP